MKNFKKGAAFGVAFAVAGLGLAAPAFAAEDTTPTKPTCDSLPIAERILCLKGDPKSKDSLIHSKHKTITSKNRPMK